MRFYTRYILYHLLTPFLVILLSLTGIVWLTQALRLVDLIVNRGLSIDDFFYLSSLLIPSLLGITMPIALFCSVIFIYNKLIIDSELIVLKSAGLSKLQLSKPALMLATFSTLIGYTITFYFLPASYREFKDMKMFIRDHYASMLLQEGVFNSPIDGLTVYIDSRDEKTGQLQGILVHDNRKADAPITMMANEGKIVRTPYGPHFDLQNGNRQEMNRKDAKLTVLDFDRYSLDLSLYSSSTSQRVRKPQELFIHELFQEAQNQPHIGKFYAEAQQRITWPLNNIMLPLIALSILLSGELNRRGQWRRVWTAAILVTSILVINLGFYNIVAKNAWLAPMMYAIILLPAFIAFLTLCGWHPIKRRRA